MRNRWIAFASVLVGTLAVFGLIIATGLVSIAVAGLLQWIPVLGWADEALTFVVLAGGLMLAGRVGVDVARSRGLWCAVLACGLFAMLGALVASLTETHGEGLEAGQVAIAAGIVLLFTVGTAAVVTRRRRRVSSPKSQSQSEPAMLGKKP